MEYKDCEGCCKECDRYDKDEICSVIYNALKDQAKRASNFKNYIVEK